MTALIVHSACEYLTAGGTWRDEDYKARGIVKSVKGDDFGGYFEVAVAGVPRRFTKDNKDEFLNVAGARLAARLAELTSDRVTLVPVPNSHACVGTTPDFRTLRLAEAMAAHSKGQAVAQPAFLWRKPKERQHQSSGYRHASQFIPNLYLIAPVRSPVIMIDDMVTSGSQMLACTYLLRKAGVEVRFGMTVGRVSAVQTSSALAWSDQKIEQLIL